MVCLWSIVQITNILVFFFKSKCDYCYSCALLRLLVIACCNAHRPYWLRHIVSLVRIEVLSITDFLRKFRRTDSKPEWRFRHMVICVLVFIAEVIVLDMLNFQKRYPLIGLNRSLFELSLAFPRRRRYVDQKMLAS